jgi:iron only hydrogenase large subunit-like protein
MVVIIGNDAVLAAAPATPVQIAHACLRRGFTVAVPASWGDELVAAEAVRRLASRERGPAVMCVCPFVRSRLLAPGPDLAPFLVSLVSPPVATARYLRAVYGEHGVHITYIGGCPSAEDISIDRA